MAKTLTVPPLRQRDGTSQAARFQEPLDPGYVRVDERTVEDFLRFAREYGKELRYYGFDNEPAGDWSAFMDPRLTPADVLALLDESEPEPGVNDRIASSLRPHFVLFLGFLKLLRDVQLQLNGLTRRHLDFYYRRILRMRRKSAVPDRVNLLFDLAAGTLEALVPAGSLLSAGPDRQGTQRIYATDRDLVVNRAEVARLSTLHIERRNADWLSFSPAEDATAILANSGGEDGPSPWRTFGEPLSDTAQPLVGWALGSALLAMGEGRRRVRLSLCFDPDSFAEKALRELFRDEHLSAESPLRCELSNEEGWIEPRQTRVTVETGTPLPELLFDIELTEDDAPVTPLAQASLPQASQALPMLRLMLRPIRHAEHRHAEHSHAEHSHAEHSHAEHSRYLVRGAPLEHLRLVSAQLEVRVTGLRPLLASNDEATLETDKPFEPFGMTPMAGSRLRLAHPELAGKPLDTLRFDFEWMDLPENLTRHYRHYDLGEDPFTIRVSWTDQRRERTLLDAVELFSYHRTKHGALATDRVRNFTVDGVASVLGDRPFSEGVLQWELNAPDFQHRAYPAVASRKAMEMAAAFAARQEEEVVEAADYEVTPPYTPKIKDLRLGYICTSEIRLDEPDGGAFHVHPWGTCDFSSSEGFFLPRYENEGELYIALTGVRARQSVALLFQMAEGSADPGLEPERPQWSYLSGDRWLSLDDGNVLTDTTRGLINSGILELDLEPARPNQRLPGSYYWIRAAVAKSSRALCDTVAIHAQAASATFVDHGNAPDHFGEPLAAGSITELAEPLPEIAGIRQPYTSHGGRMAEADDRFNNRVSERLRHKGRALAMWDYERLVLERFPEIYKVKCFPVPPAPRHEDPAGLPMPAGRDRREHDHGRVVVVVCPDIRGKLPFDPFAPKVRADLLADIEAFLAARASACANLEVRNAHYVAVRIRVSVRFKQRGNEGYYRNLLHEELNRYLSAWAYEEGADVVVGGKIYANNVVDFIDRRPYVDYLADLELFSSDDGKNFRPAPPGTAEEGYHVTTELPDGVLLAAREHHIELIPESGIAEDLQMGMHFMQVELDLKVS